MNSAPKENVDSPENLIAKRQAIAVAGDGSQYDEIKKHLKIVPKPLEVTLNEKLPQIESLLREAGYGYHDVTELLRLFAGLYVLTRFAVSESGFDRDKVNMALLTHLGNGHSWYSSLKFLTGERAKSIFVARCDVIREIGGIGMVRAFNIILPQTRDVIDLL